jgi:hypothetical protein
MTGHVISVKFFKITEQLLIKIRDKIIIGPPFIICLSSPFSVISFKLKFI